jgi:hypothetical protein
VVLEHIRKRNSIVKRGTPGESPDKVERLDTAIIVVEVWVCRPRRPYRKVGLAGGSAKEWAL